jgi:hypothetical protein
MALLYAPYLRASDQSNVPISGAFLSFYATQTSTPQPIYADVNLTVPLQNPLPSDSNGVWPAIWLDDSLPAYKVVMQYPDAANPGLPGAIVAGPNGTIDPYNAALSAIGLAQIINPTTDVENGIGVVPVNFLYPAGHAYRYGVNAIPGTTDMTAAINTAANVCRQGNYLLQVPQTEKLLVSSSLIFSRVHAVGLGNALGFNGGIQASAAQFDIIVSTGGMVLDNVWVDGGWDGHTPGLSGDSLSLTAVSPAHPYINSLINCNFQNNKKRGIYIERGGYTDLFHCVSVTSGLHAFECFGLNTDECTSIRDYGGQYGGTPYGYGLKLTECAAMIFQGTIIEATNGIQLAGSDNRTITFDGIYQEFNPTPSFTAKIDNGSGGAGTILTVTAPATLAGLGVGSIISGAGVTANTVITGTGTGTGGTGTYTVNNSQNITSEAMTASILLFNDLSAGIGLSIRGMFGANLSFPFAPGIPSFGNWVGVYFSGNSNLVEGPIPLAGRIQTNSAGQGTVTVTSDVTTGQLSLTPGTYRLSGVVQTIISTGGGTATQLACQITTNSAASGLNTSTVTLAEGAAQTQSFGSSQDARVNCYTVVQVFVTTIYYLRAHILLVGTITEAYNGQLRAELINS